jgi:hypothetical protein
MGRRFFKYRGGIDAYEAGAVAALGRSLIQNGWHSISARSYVEYQDETSDYTSVDSKIPIACLTNEDVDLIARLAKRGEEGILMHMHMIRFL